MFLMDVLGKVLGTSRRSPRQQALIGRSSTHIRFKNYSKDLVDAEMLSSLLPESEKGLSLAGLCFLGLQDLNSARNAFDLA
jgi:hypothetical protein